MNKAPLFLHRPPSVGIHLLSDPLPERHPSPSGDTSSDKSVTSSKRLTRVSTKKTGLRS